jgi:hypothetical protein
MVGKVPGSPSTLAELEAETNRQLARVKAGAAAFGTLVAITFGGLSANLMNAAPRILLALLATAIIVSGFVIARTYRPLIRDVQGLTGTACGGMQGACGTHKVAG